MTTATRKIAFIDSRVADYQTLIDGLAEGTEWFLLDACLDGIRQMESILSGYGDLDAIQVISHGSQGTLYLGSTVLDSGNLTDYEQQLGAIATRLTDTGDILFYGCNVAAGELGQGFVEAVARFTQADVAASTDITGTSTLGGNWVLEWSSGMIETPSLAPGAYAATLDGVGLLVEVEDNNTLGQATALVLAEDPAGSGLALGYGLGRQDPAVYGNRWSDPDYWRIELQAGDVVSVSVDTPASGVDSYVELRNGADQYVTANSDGGPDADAFISHYVVTESGSYYIRVGKDTYTSESGDYVLRVERTRGIQLETDANYQNDTIGGANALALTQAGTHQTATVAGTLMVEGSYPDEDVFNLGVFNAGNVVELSTRLPGTSTLVPKVTLLDAAGAVIADTDGNSSDGHVLATLAGDGAVYAKVASAWEHGGHRYVLTENAMAWAAAEAYAQTLGGRLVTVDDAAEQAWLTVQFGGFNPWIGYTDQAVEGTWVWASGSGSSYLNWGSNEPNQSDSRLDAAYMSSDGSWHAYYNEPWANYYHGLIELDSASGSTDKGPGPQAQYLLDVDIADQVAPRVVSVTGLPVDGATAALPVGPSVTVTLSEALAATTVNTNSGGVLTNWTLTSAGADGVFDTADDGTYRLVLAEAYTGGTTVKLRIEGSEAGQAVSLGEGQYRLTASAALTDGAGNALDGNGDGTGGDGFVRSFTIALPAGRTFEGENNNTQAQATALVLAEDPAGSGLALGYGLGRQGPAVYGNRWSDPDYWRIELQAGDVVSVSVDTPASGVDSYVELRNGADQYVTANSDGGPDADAFISHYVVTESGSYYIRVGKDTYTSESGDYVLRVERTRGIQLETDANYQNDAISGANALTWVPVAEHRTAVVAGTLMSNGEKDYFNLGTINAGETIFLSVRLPDSSTLVPILEIRDANNNVVSIAPNPSQGVARFDVEQTGTYDALVLGYQGQGTHGQYLLDAAVWPTGSLEFADLSVTAVSGPTVAASGETIHLDWTVGNFGTGATDVSTWYDRIVLSANDKYGDYDDITLNAVQHSGALAPNQEYTAGADVQLPLAVSGNYRLLVATDDGHAVFEYLFESNNIGQAGNSIDIALTPSADLQPGDLSIPLIGVAGQASTINWTVTNQGAGATGNGAPGGTVGSWTDRVVLSVNNVYGDGDDRLVGDLVHNGALNPGENYVASFSGNLPQGVSGEYRVFVATDLSNTVHEGQNSQPNVVQSLGTIKIAPTPFADLTVTQVTAPGTGQSGEQVLVEWTVANTSNVKIHPPKKFPSSSNWYVIMLLLDDDPTQCTFASTTFCKWTPSG